MSTCIRTLESGGVLVDFSGEVSPTEAVTAVDEVTCLLERSIRHTSLIIIFGRDTRFSLQAIFQLHKTIGFRTAALGQLERLICINLNPQNPIVKQLRSVLQPSVRTHFFQSKAEYVAWLQENRVASA